MFSTSSARWGRRFHPSCSVSAPHHPREGWVQTSQHGEAPGWVCRRLGEHNRGRAELHFRGVLMWTAWYVCGFSDLPCTIQAGVYRCVTLESLLGKLLQPMTFEVPVFLQLGGQLCTPQQHPKVDQDCPAFWKTAWWRWLAEDRRMPRYVPRGRLRHSQNLVYEHSQ